jgi:hypothetical protein
MVSMTVPALTAWAMTDITCGCIGWRIAALISSAACTAAWTGERLIYETPDGLFSAAVESTDPITLGEPEALASYHLENTAQRWIFPAPDLETFMVYERVQAAQPVIRWWLNSADGSPVEVSEDLYSLGICCAWSPDGERPAYRQPAERC